MSTVVVLFGSLFVVILIASIKGYCNEREKKEHIFIYVCVLHSVDCPTVRDDCADGVEGFVWLITGLVTGADVGVGIG